MAKPPLPVTSVPSPSPPPSRPTTAYINCFEIVHTNLHPDLYPCLSLTPKAQISLSIRTLTPIWHIRPVSDPTPHPSLISETASLCCHSKADLNTLDFSSEHSHPLLTLTTTWLALSTALPHRLVRGLCCLSSLPQSRGLGSQVGVLQLVIAMTKPSALALFPQLQSCTKTDTPCYIHSLAQTNPLHSLKIQVAVHFHSVQHTSCHNSSWFQHVQRSTLWHPGTGFFDLISPNDIVSHLISATDSPIIKYFITSNCKLSMVHGAFCPLPTWLCISSRFSLLSCLKQVFGSYHRDKEEHAVCCLH